MQNITFCIKKFIIKITFNYEIKFVVNVFDYEKYSCPIITLHKQEIQNKK